MPERRRPCLLVLPAPPRAGALPASPVRHAGQCHAGRCHEVATLAPRFRSAAALDALSATCLHVRQTIPADGPCPCPMPWYSVSPTHPWQMPNPPSGSVYFQTHPPPLRIVCNQVIRQTAKFCCNGECLHEVLHDLSKHADKRHGQDRLTPDRIIEQLFARFISFHASH